MTRNYLVLAISLLLMLSTRAQSVAINTDGSLPNPNAILDVKSGTKGILIPRMDSVARMAVPNTKGLLVYDTSTSSFWYNTGAQWKNIAAASAAVADSAWLLTGNSGTVDSINFLGTLDNVPLNFRVNNQPSGRIDQINGNAFWGYRSGLSNNTGTYNTAIGTASLQNNSSGAYNTAGGFEALFANSTGQQNTANGYQSLHSNSTGYYNTATGGNSLLSNTTGYANTATGLSALYSNTAGINNTATGLDALHNNTTGSNNTATGLGALHDNTVGSYNTVMGVQALFSQIDGIGLTAIGYQSQYLDFTGFAKHFGRLSKPVFHQQRYRQYAAVGYKSLSACFPSGSDNTAVGSMSLSGISVGGSNTAIGANTMATSGISFFNTAVGTDALFSNSSGSSNIAIGSISMINNTVGGNNVAIGSGALQANTTGNGKIQPLRDQADVKQRR